MIIDMVFPSISPNIFASLTSISSIIHICKQKHRNIVVIRLTTQNAFDCQMKIIREFRSQSARPITS